jgi:hypothetical protein
MPAAQYDLAIPAGGTVDLTVEVVDGPATLEGYTGLMHIRALRNDEVTLAVVPPEAISVNPSARLVTVTIPSSLTETWTFRRGVYDLRITGPSDDSWIVVEGRVTNKLAVTRGA